MGSSSALSGGAEIHSSPEAVVKTIGDLKALEPSDRDGDAPRAREALIPRATRSTRAKREPQTWALTGGVGWLYGIGCVCGPFYGIGVGLTLPGGILAGAGGGVGLAASS